MWYHRYVNLITARGFVCDPAYRPLVRTLFKALYRKQIAAQKAAQA